MHKFILLASVAGVLVATGCTPSDPSPALNPDESPLSPYYVAISDYETSNADTLVIDSDADPDQYGELVSSCMQTQGFKYWPVPVAGNEDLYGLSEEDEPAAGEAALEYAAENGYGITTPYSDLDPTNSPETSDATDPNEEYVAELSPEMLQAYNDALYGTMWDEVTDSDDLESIEWDWRKAGCDGAAQHELSNEVENADSDWKGPETTPYDDLIEQMNSLYENVEYADAWQQLTEQWATCMAGKGHNYSTWDEAMESVLEHYSDLMEPMQLDENLKDDVTVELDEETPVLPPRSKYEALYNLERDVAVADLECQDEIDRQGVEAQILWNLEAEFLQKNRSRLDDMKRWFEVYGGGSATP